MTLHSKILNLYFLILKVFVEDCSRPTSVKGRGVKTNPFETENESETNVQWPPLAVSD